MQESAIGDSQSEPSAPIVVAINSEAATTVLSSIGFEAGDIWLDLKVPLLDTLVLKLTPISAGVSQMVELQNPNVIEAGAVARLKLTLVTSCDGLPGNESLIRLQAIANDQLHRSRLINMEVY